MLCYCAGEMVQSLSAQSALPEVRNWISSSQVSVTPVLQDPTLSSVSELITMVRNK